MRGMISSAVAPDGASKLREEYEKLLDTIEFGEEMDEQTKEKYNTKIQAKLEAGKELSAKEMRYLQRYNPMMYMHALRIQMQRHALKTRLEHAKSKREVQNIQADAMGAIGKNDPVKKYMVAMVQDTVAEFKKTDAYKRLPEKEEDEKVRGNKSRSMAGQAKNKTEQEITYEMRAGAYQMAFVTEAAEQSGGFSVRS
ncbi:MAG: hypothetical protein IJY09_05850 [Lachnospiraceae bacterium]|nr:hypothetical protein [Lachnospiraceae bacterium]